MSGSHIGSCYFPWFFFVVAAAVAGAAVDDTNIEPFGFAQLDFTNINLCSVFFFIHFQFFQFYFTTVSCAASKKTECQPPLNHINEMNNISLIKLSTNECRIIYFFFLFRFYFLLTERMGDLYVFGSWLPYSLLLTWFKLSCNWLTWYVWDFIFEHESFIVNSIHRWILKLHK